MPMSYLFPLNLAASKVCTHIRIVGFYVKTAIIHQSKRLCVPDCTYMESMFINFIYTSLYNISVMQIILYSLKRDAAVWKRLECPQRTQRTWWKWWQHYTPGLEYLSNAIDVWSATWILVAWCFSTSTPVATVLITHAWVSLSLWVKENIH